MRSSKPITSSGARNRIARAPSSFSNPGRQMPGYTGSRPVGADAMRWRSAREHLQLKTSRFSRSSSSARS
jgi:hypothetical protein